MIITIPDYYKEFECIADRCEDTCCAGWQIVIDKETLKKYTKMKGNFRKRMFSSVNWFQGTFKQDKNKRCAFLNERNLCDLYLSQGEGGFCKTCREYPRHTEEFEGVREMTLSVSCPEVARILMNRIEPVTFLSYEREGEEEFEDFDPFFFSILEDARKEMITILQNRNLTIKDRILLVLGMAHDMQGRMNRQEMFACSEVIAKYTTEKALHFVQSYQQKQSGEETKYQTFLFLDYANGFGLLQLRFSLSKTEYSSREQSKKLHNIMASIFTRIINGEIPCYKVAEDENFIAFLDINPLVEGHTLVVPKIEEDYIFDLDDETLAKMMAFAKKVAAQIKTVTECKRVAIAVLGMEVPHAHMHLIPMNTEGDVDFKKARPEVTKEQFAALVEKLAI